MGLLRFSQQTAIISLYTSNRLAFLMETQCVSSDAGTEYFNIFKIKFLRKTVKCHGIFLKQIKTHIIKTHEDLTYSSVP
jgi:hypothetical protein